MDYGAVRIGIAVSDPTQTLASPLTTIENNRQAIAKIKKISEDYEVSTIVVGYPLNLKGEAAASTESVDKFIDNLKNLKHKVIRWDERFTSVTAMNLLRQAGVKLRNDKGRIDRSAAAVILQHYLDSSGNRPEA